MKNSVNSSLCIILMTALLSQTSPCFADLNENEFNQLKSKQLAAINGLNQKYAQYLAALLEKVKANKDDLLASKIRQEMADIGFPSIEDWILGEWNVKDPDGGIRTYVFTVNGSASHTMLNGKPTKLSVPGSYTRESSGAVRVVMGPLLLIVSQGPSGVVSFTRWNDVKDYPDKTKAFTGIANR